MTQPGYPDYERLSLSSGILLAGGQQAFTGPTNLFQGYVGNIPYIDFFWDAVAGPGHVNVQVTYWQDDTFTTQVAFTASVRTTNSIGYRQLSVLSPWLTIIVFPDTATDHTLCTYAFYGSTQSASSAKLGSLDSAFFEVSAAVAASTSAPFQIVKIYPGAAVLSWTILATAWQIQLQRWDYGAAAWKTFLFLGNTGAPASGTATVALPDAPIQAVLVNGDAAAKTFNVFLMPLI